MIVGGDIGGTKADLAVFEMEAGRLAPVASQTFASADFAGAGEILTAFLDSSGADKAQVCLGLPGPVREGICRTTNLPWVVDTRELGRLAGVSRVVLINDLEAAGYGLPLVDPKDLIDLNPKGLDRPGNRVLASAGTGLGEAILFWDGETWHPSASEGSHVDFAPRDGREWGLFQYLTGGSGHLSYDRLVSGPGLVELYTFLSAKDPDRADSDIAGAINPDSGPAIIARAALEGSCPVCQEALDWLISLYGAEAGNLALKALALGGVYLGGGIAPKILPALKSGIFMESFLAKGRMSELLSTVPVRVIMEPRTSLLGAGFVAWQQTRS